MGFNLSQYLAQKGHRITLLDRDDYCQRLVHISPLHEMPFICCDLASDRIHLPPGTGLHYPSGGHATRGLFVSSARGSFPQ
ncbi:hypothetical protein [Paenibacillus amylolyticus]|uniref:hypothetical protein n=1 Tax=Paenibacillus amylolyticus TaxID=1451 RepID=UPI003CE44901